MVQKTLLITDEIPIKLFSRSGDYSSLFKFIFHEAAYLLVFFKELPLNPGNSISFYACIFCSAVEWLRAQSLGSMSMLAALIGKEFIGVS